MPVPVCRMNPNESCRNNRCDIVIDNSITVTVSLEFLKYNRKYFTGSMNPAGKSTSNRRRIDVESTSWSTSKRRRFQVENANRIDVDLSTSKRRRPNDVDKMTLKRRRQNDIETTSTK